MIRKLIFGGAVRINRQKIKGPDFLVKRGDLVEVRVSPKTTAKQEAEKRVGMAPLEVLFEDDWLLAVNKPSGIPTHPTVDPARPNLYGLCLKHLHKQSNRPSYLGLHHRLDRDTSGVVLFSKSTDVNQQLGAMFADRTMKKSYVAITVSSVKFKDQQQWKVDNHLGVVGKRHGKSIYGAVKSGGDRATTEFEILDRTQANFAILAKPLTGRTHQIRVHLLSSGVPILGDELYFLEKSGAFERLFLHAWKLEFVHPVTLQTQTIDAPIPAEFQKIFPRL